MTSLNTVEAKPGKESGTISTERPKSPHPMADAVIHALWKEYLSIVEQGKTFISFEDFEKLLEKGVMAAEKEHQRIVDKECQAWAKAKNTALWADNYLSSGLD